MLCATDLVGRKCTRYISNGIESFKLVQILWFTMNKSPLQIVQAKKKYIGRILELGIHKKEE